MEKSPFTFFEKRFAVAKKNRSLISKIGEKRLFFLNGNDFSIFFLSERSGKNGDFSILPLSKTFEGFCLYIYIYHISVFFRNYDSAVSPSRIEKSPFWMEISPFKLFLEAFRFEPFFNLSIFFSTAFSPFGMEKSPFRMEISPFKLFQTRYEHFFKNVSFLFLPEHFLHSEWRNLHPEWRFLLLTSELRFLHTE